MQRAIALIDYGAGNLTSVRKGFAAVNVELVTATRATDLESAAGIVVPGVGHFAATAALSGEWHDTIHRRVQAGVPLLGICLGMQWLFAGSDEAPDIGGLGALAGQCTRLHAPRLKVPHVGWNTLDVVRPDTILDGIEPGTSVYFTHSYVAPVTSDCVATASHGVDFAAVVQREHIAGLQFHPEKSGQAGLQMLRNFVQLLTH